PRRRAAERAAGPPPRMMASQTVDSVTVRQLVHLFGEPGPGDPLRSVPTPAAPVERAAPDLDLSDPLAAVVQPEPERGPGLRELRHAEIRFALVLTDDSSSDQASPRSVQRPSRAPRQPGQPSEPRRAVGSKVLCAPAPAPVPPAHPGSVHPRLASEPEDVLERNDRPLRD